MPCAPKSRAATLSAAEIGAIIDDVTHYRYSDMEIAAFLIGSASFMTSGELLALTHAMAQAGTQLDLGHGRSSSTSIASAAFRATAPR